MGNKLVISVRYQLCVLRISDIKSRTPLLDIMMMRGLWLVFLLTPLSIQGLDPWVDIEFAFNNSMVDMPGLQDVDWFNKDFFLAWVRARYGKDYHVLNTTDTLDVKPLCMLGTFWNMTLMSCSPCTPLADEFFVTGICWGFQDTQSQRCKPACLDRQYEFCPCGNVTLPHCPVGDRICYELPYWNINVNVLFLSHYGYTGVLASYAQDVTRFLQEESQCNSSRLVYHGASLHWASGVYTHNVTFELMGIWSINLFGQEIPRLTPLIEKASYRADLLFFFYRRRRNLLEITSTNNLSTCPTNAYMYNYSMWGLACVPCNNDPVVSSTSLVFLSLFAQNPCGSNQARICPAGSVYPPSCVTRKTPVWTLNASDVLFVSDPICPPDNYYVVLDYTNNITLCEAFQCVAGWTGIPGACTTCPWGTYKNETGSGPCIPCGLGYFTGMVGSILCQACPSGTFTSSQGLSVCQNCPAGMYSGIPGSPICMGCEKDTISSIGESSCSRCPSNQFTESVGSSVCLSCVGLVGMGWNQSVDGCAPCGPGYYSQSLEGVCNPCPMGAFSNISGMDGECFACIPGTFSHSVGSIVCEPCFPGTFGGNCTPCPSGSYQVMYNLSKSCDTCGMGMYSSGLGMSSPEVCRNCEMGTYWQSSSQCMDCPEHTISPGGAMGIQECKVVDGFYSTLGGRRELCPINHFCTKATTLPTPCPDGLEAPEGSSICKGGTNGLFSYTIYAWVMASSWVIMFILVIGGYIRYRRIIVWAVSAPKGVIPVKLVIPLV